jgi:segregation and condensation protein A
MSTAYTIQLDVYEGPLDLLLELIQQAQLDITKIALARVTDQYLAYLEQLPEHHLEDLSSFLVMAARLLQIKSEALLPRPPIREPGEEDPGDALARQLIAYKKYKQVAVLLSERIDADLRSHSRLVASPVGEQPIQIEGVDLNDLRQAFLDVLTTAPDQSKVQHPIEVPKIKIRERIAAILHALKQATRITFRRLFSGPSSRLEIVVSFLAILELIKQQQIEVHQEKLFGEINIERGQAWNPGQDSNFELEFEE